MTPTVGTSAPEAGSRPRVEGDREQEILDATLDVLADVGYDRLTMDAVAAQARASKATLYRRWSTKAALVIDALLSMKEPHELPDTGDHIARADDRGALLKALAQLPPRQREAVVLRYWEDLTETQAAQAMGCSVGAVKSNAAKGIAKLRAIPGLAETVTHGGRK
jgi:RNA polymerase sigma factor (sigma-70 family)